MHMHATRREFLVSRPVLRHACVNSAELLCDRSFHLEKGSRLVYAMLSDLEQFCLPSASFLKTKEFSAEVSGETELIGQSNSYSLWPMIMYFAKAGVGGGEVKFWSSCS